MVGSTWRELLESQVTILRREIGRFRGREVKQIGDGCLATFDGPARAIRCGLAMIQAVKSLGVDIRVGLHTGEVEMMDDDSLSGASIARSRCSIAK